MQHSWLCCVTLRYARHVPVASDLTRFVEPDVDKEFEQIGRAMGCFG
ncbi:MAG: hypothetical protein ABJL99_18805 [Aliishimia sp.]